MSEETTAQDTAVETPATPEVKTEPTVELFSSAVVEKIANGYVARSNGNTTISAFLNKADLMAFLDITIPEV